MPDKPVWYSRLEEIIGQLTDFPDLYVDRATLEQVMGVGRRRAQQILQPLVRRRVGRSGLAFKEDVIAQLRRLAAGETAQFEIQRRQRLHAILDGLHAQARQQPRVLVEAPDSIINQEIETLPPGVHLSPGCIRIEDFRTSEEVKQKLLALILAMGNDPDGFDARITIPE